MADLVRGAMSSLIPKLGELLKEEYNLQTGVKERIRSLTRELEGAQAALHKVAQVPWDQLDEQVKLWAREVRESSYDMEDVLDKFLVHVKGPDSAKEGSLKRLGEKMANLFKKSKARREISIGVEDIMTHLDEVTKRCRRYKVNDTMARPAIASTVDPRLAAMYNKVKNLVGIDKPSGELISFLQTQQRGDVTNGKLKIVSVVGVGGLGKTTIAKAVYDKLKDEYDHRAFVPVGRNPDLKKIIKGILIELDKERYMKFNFALLDEIHQFINELRDFLLENKRYFIVVDDIWEVQSWETIKLAFDDDGNCGGRIIITTRIWEVATKASEVYKLQQLSYESSRELFYITMSGNHGSCVDYQPDEVSDKILKKCDGIPLAIIVMARLLVEKPKEKWWELYKSIGFGLKDNNGSENTIFRILSFSCYDMPSHLRTCLLYLSAFPEDSVIHKDALVWRWVAEGFVCEEQGMRLFEIGEGYFNDLVNRSMIQAIEDVYDDGIIIGCYVHDMVLDFIRSMSCDENFFTILDNDRGTQLPSNVRRLAQHNMTMGRTHLTNHFVDMPNVRSFIAWGCVIETWVPLFSFTPLRVLAIENCYTTDDCRIRIEHLGRLFHLRYLSLRGTYIEKIPEEIGGLRFLQTLDLWGSDIEEIPPCSSLPKQLVCLRIAFGDRADDEVVSVESLTSLEELTIKVMFTCRSRRWLVKEAGSLRELRVLNASISWDGESKRDLVESLHHLHKLQHLEIDEYFFQGNSKGCTSTWEAAGLVLPRHLRHLVVKFFSFDKLPPCIDTSCLPNLSRLELSLQYVDDQDLKILGRLPELRFLGLQLCCSATVSNVSDCDAVYFPKLRCCRLKKSMVLFVANKEDKSVSFHLWDGYGDIAMPSTSPDELQTSMRFDSGHEKKGSICRKGAAAIAPPLFMPSLETIEFRVHHWAVEDHRYYDNLNLDYLSSLRKIDVIIDPPDGTPGEELEKVEVALRRAADRHPNRPTLRASLDLVWTLVSGD
ncbi:hypothetical protein BS78_05G285000 [Paspalum vaginatum]|nr:hypothetical protein BS78_05G285000 [Paspalum vaginatum]KAJ1277311.1 hypothetical protein BS78_05G285000 [Paspalum vaginatum]KAJ1277312.1 hypothetical protein BS78_05G285000 [Paspalum vaginatum]